RPARADDVADLVSLVRELAAYERALEQAIATEADFTRDLFGPSPRVHALVADVDGTLIGYAIYFLNYSTWLGKHGLFLEDLYVRPAHRGLGAGTALLRALAQECVDHGYGRFEWSVLDWNEPALGFYRSLGANAMDEWTVQRLTGDALGRLASGHPRAGDTT
ncbi:MAG: GNAT family N-acetyltransferase, partial [Candidatus Nanopelagicales bacterium]|nr:GNAT family N-acetyltransferase [Candidatus Nanopelagicales bacterium]